MARFPGKAGIPENTIIRLEANAEGRYEHEQGNPSEEIKDGGMDVGTKGRKNVKKPKRQVEKKAQKAEQAEQKKR